MRMKLVVSLAALSATGAILVAGCSGSSTDNSAMSGMSDSTSMSMSMSMSPSGTPVPGAVFNGADVTFASDMYPHHAQALEMAQLVPSRSTDPSVIALAAAIETAQKPEMDQMATWLTEWGQPNPSSDMGTMGGDSGVGMMSQQDMDALTALSGADFDRRWLIMMIEHHTGAVAMADIEIAQGSNPDAIVLARAIVTAQNAEIEQMKQLLG